MYAGEKEGGDGDSCSSWSAEQEILWNEAERLETRGFAVIASNEQPVVYFTKSDYKSGSKMKAHQKINKRGPVRGFIKEEN